MDLNELNQILDRIKFQVAELKTASENVGEYQTCVVDISKAIKEFEQNALKIVSTNSEILTANKTLSKNMDARTIAQNEAIDGLFDKLQKAITNADYSTPTNAFEKKLTEIIGSTLNNMKSIAEDMHTLNGVLSTNQNRLKENAERVQKQINGLSLKVLFVVGFSCLALGVAIGIGSTLYASGAPVKTLTSEHPALPEKYYGIHNGKPILYFSLDDKSRMVGYSKEKNICYIGLEANN
ncbi:MAG: hypothetical protein PHE67_04655 [Campylobacterales bacterium]|nr:hypothetical protein [Campylobacterales bacterium]